MSRHYPCVYCTEDLHCTRFSEPGYESWCVLGPCAAETPSHGDAIRRMDDEELADLIYGIIDERDQFWIEKLRERGVSLTMIKAPKLSTSCHLDWLKRPARKEGQEG